LVEKAPGSGWQSLGTFANRYDWKGEPVEPLALQCQAADCGAELVAPFALD